MCTSVVKRTISGIVSDVVMFLRVLTFKKPSTGSIYLRNFQLGKPNWKLGYSFKMLEDGRDTCILALSSNTLGLICYEKFNVGNGARQRGVLSPYLFTRFVLPLISQQCNFGGLFANFYPRDAMLARVIAIATCLSVCLSVRHASVLCQNEES